MINVYFVLSSLSGGGAERFFLYLINSLDRSKFHVHLILFNASGDYKEMLAENVNVIDLKIKSGGLSFFNTIIILHQTLSKLKPDVVFSTMGYTNLVCMIAKGVGNLQLKLIIHEAGILRHQLSYGRFSLIKRLIYRICCQYADVIVFPAQAVKDDFKSYIGAYEEKYKVIPTPFDDKYINQMLMKPWSKEAYKVNTDRKIIISMGRLEKIKGFDLGLKAFVKVRQHMPCYYWILGQGSEEQKLKQLAQDLGVAQDVFFLGFQQNPFIFLKQADVCLLPSYSETLPYVMMEAMYCQCPCVATPFNRSAGEVIKHGINGMLVIDFNADQLAESLMKVLNDSSLRNQMALNAHKTAIYFSVEQLRSTYEQLLSLKD